ncbi:MAG TPA: tyrosine-type recombinase/integrase [Steroidobacteraceae bacterium]|nr:tyrosine-type recombinase/integrase [Steroidobacteraceae bacterium]
MATLPPGDHTDPATAGLQLRVRPTATGASRTWLFRYTWRGEWVRIVIGHFPGMPLADARGRALELRKAIDEGIDPRRARPRRREQAPTQFSTDAAHGDKHSIDYLASEFIHRYLRPHRKRPEWAEAILKRDVLPAWRGRDARTIEPAEVLELLDGIVERGSNVMANRTASLLGQLFKFGIHRHIVRTTPVQLLFRPGGKEKPRKRTLAEDELRAYLTDPRACTRYERLEHVINILLLTGQRRGELALARWSEVDLQARTWLIPDENAKEDQGHAVPLTDWAVEEFAALKREAEASAWVLPAPDGENHINPKQLSRSLAKCLKRFETRGIKAFTLHDLRRTCRTGLSRLKVEPHIAERILNHAQPGMEGIYDQYAYLDEKRAALQKWAAHLRSLGTQQ